MGEVGEVVILRFVNVDKIVNLIECWVSLGWVRQSEGFFGNGVGGHVVDKGCNGSYVVLVKDFFKSY